MNVDEFNDYAEAEIHELNPEQDFNWENASFLEEDNEEYEDIDEVDYEQDTALED